MLPSWWILDIPDWPNFGIGYCGSINFKEVIMGLLSTILLSGGIAFSVEDC